MLQKIAAAAAAAAAAVVVVVVAVIAQDKAGRRQVICDLRSTRRNKA